MSRANQFPAMVTVRRLLGLNSTAGSEDIRAFFHGLYIPEGGVHIIGGRRGEAFIIFNSERDGQLALERSGELLRGSSITLHLSSLAELKRKIESRLRKRKHSSVQKKVESGRRRVHADSVTKLRRRAEDQKKAKLEKRRVEEEKKVAEPQAAQSADLGTALLLGLVAAIQGMQSNNQESQSQSPPTQTKPCESEIQGVDQTYCTSKVQESNAHVRAQEESGRTEVKTYTPGYLRLYGFNSHVTKKEVCRFLKGLSVLDVLPNAFLDGDWCCLVKLASLSEAEEGLKYNYTHLGDSCVQVRRGHQRMWVRAMALHENGQSSKATELDRVSPDRRPFRASPVKRLSEDRSLSGSPKRRHFDSWDSGTEYCVMVKNLSPQMNKTQIKELFSCLDIPSHRIIHLLDQYGNRTSTAFITFTDPERYASTMNMDGTPFGSKTLVVSSVTKEKMRTKLKESKRPAHHVERDWTALSCIYARNFPADVTKRQVKDFFAMHRIHENDVLLLQDDCGNSIGEAVVEFGSEWAAKQACSLHGGNFLGQQIILTCISPQQMKTVLHATH